METRHAHVGQVPEETVSFPENFPVPAEAEYGEAARLRDEIRHLEAKVASLNRQLVWVRESILLTAGRFALSPNLAREAQSLMDLANVVKGE
jgi:hypothetical protein